VRVVSAFVEVQEEFLAGGVALRADGVWRVVEVGDGQVSDLHRSSDGAQLSALLVGV
jgi:hypothetical protein